MGDGEISFEDFDDRNDDDELSDIWAIRLFPTKSRGSSQYVYP